ncbi:putative tRNA pseudouridine synthase Pus10 [Papilio machaon]|uniref:putative tRNA pseudouridine synthase Pus10 n=1 Tax=Papilio machaon TaxID=76193 RepID=UPI001E664675|nr:putative tRNA pseudouridine synthase Pus10 [Papilio machaon]
MDDKNIFNVCKQAGCCDSCSLRYLGLKSSTVYEDVKKSAQRYKEEKTAVLENEQPPDDANKVTTADSDSAPPAKKIKLSVCVICLGILQEETWDDSFSMVKEVLERKKYTSNTFACALSSPIATILRERAMALRLENEIPNYDSNIVTPLKEAWKWSFGTKLAPVIEKKLDSGAISPLLITFNYDYLDDLQELEILKKIAAPLFESRRQQHRRFATEFTRRVVEQALENVTVEALKAASESCCMASVDTAVKCVSVVCTHSPLYLGGRYIKLSRDLPQTPWILSGRRVMPSSVQEIIFQPIADLYGMSEAEAERRLKLIAAGREDVDVRCLGQGRPFAIEITDPQRQLTTEELEKACKLIASGGDVIVKKLVPIVKDDLILLKKGEETKTKTYEAICIKLTHSEFDQIDPVTPVTVTDVDIERINTYRNTAEGDEARIEISQATPIRVLHRRPLLTRTRHIIEVHASKVPGYPQLLLLRVRTSAGTYVKEWVHGELGRTRPALAHVLGARADLLALDVTAVHLAWPPEHE